MLTYLNSPANISGSYKNEDEVGGALRKWLVDNPEMKRSDIFITTKVWPQNMEPEDVEWSLNDSLQKLGVDYVDAFLIHWPFAVERTEDHQVKLNNDGKVRHCKLFMRTIH